MATYYARKTGNINATDVWATTPGGTAGAQTFVAGDVLVANSFTVTVNVDTDLGSTGEVRNDTTGGATAGGSFSLSNGVTLTANIFAGSTGTACVTTASTVGATIVGNITGGSAASAFGVSVGGTGTLTVTGSITAGTVSNTAHGMNISAAGTVNITGNLTGGTSVANFAVGIGAAAVVTVTGNVNAGPDTTALGSGIGISAGCTLTVTGTVTGGGNSNSASIISSVGTSTITVTGTCVGGTASAGIRNNTLSTVSITRAKGGGLLSSAVGALNATSGGILNVEEIEYGDLGASPTNGPIRLTTKSSNVAVFYVPSASKKTLVDANASGLMPNAADVRSGLSYNGGNSTGTCAVPAASSVAFGVPVDATTGTAALTPAAVWDYLTASATTANSMGERLKNAATVASVGQALADAMTP